jgi:hypothetical protein
VRGYILINEGSDADVTRDRMITLAGELAIQQTELAAWWQRVPLQVLQADSEAAAPTEDGWTLAKVIDELDDKKALAYHTTNALGRPLILIGAQILKANAPRGTDWVLGPDSLATAAGHELLETAINPYLSFWSPLDATTWIPEEVGDPVQGDSYLRTPNSGVYLSNFVGPRYFSYGAGPYDRMGLVRVPREIRPGGYQTRLVGGPGGASNDVFGAAPHAGGMPLWKREAKACAGSRHSLLLARAAA